jgi:hypothetical protein
VKQESRRWTRRECQTFFLGLYAALYLLISTLRRKNG